VNPETQIEKLKVVVNASVQIHPALQGGAFAMLTYLEQMLHSAHVADRGHRHTDGKSEVCFFISRAVASAPAAQVLPQGGAEPDAEQASPHGLRSGASARRIGWSGLHDDKDDNMETGTSGNVHMAAQPEFQNKDGELFGFGPAFPRVDLKTVHPCDFDPVRLVGEWKPLPSTFMRSLHLKFRDFWRRETDAADLARQRAWAAHKIDLAPGTRVLVHYGLNVRAGIILRSGFDRYDTKYRVQEDGDDDMWIDKWRCTVALCEDGGGIRRRWGRSARGWGGEFHFSGPAPSGPSFDGLPPAACSRRCNADV
jgi:hypothetical protein